MSNVRSEAARRVWAQRKSEGWKPAEVRFEEQQLADLRKAAHAVNVQAHFGRDLARLAEWCVTTCLAGGSSIHTAYLVAGTFTEGLAREWSKRP